jgi:hypothetical protein
LPSCVARILGGRQSCDDHWFAGLQPKRSDELPYFIISEPQYAVRSQPLDELDELAAAVYAELAFWDDPARPGRTVRGGADS